MQRISAATMACLISAPALAAPDCDATWIEAWKTTYHFDQKDMLSDKSFSAFCKSTAEAKSDGINLSYAGFGVGGNSSRSKAQSACGRNNRNYFSANFREVVLSYLPDAAIDAIGRACGGGFAARAFQARGAIIVEAAYYPAPGVAQAYLMPINATQGLRVLTNQEGWPTEKAPEQGFWDSIRQMFRSSTNSEPHLAIKDRALTSSYQVFAKYYISDVNTPVAITMNTSGSIFSGYSFVFLDRQISSLQWTISPVIGKKGFARCTAGTFSTAEFKVADLKKYGLGKCRLAGGVAAVFDPGFQPYSVGFSWIAKPSVSDPKVYECFRLSRGREFKLPGVYNNKNVADGENGARICAERDGTAADEASRNLDTAFKLLS